MRTARIAPLAASLLAVTCLSGCDKPNPTITVQSGSARVRADAACWSRKASTPVDTKGCAGRIVNIKVTPGQPIGISVDPEIAAAGWEPVISTSGLVSKPLHTTYYRFAVAEQDLANGSVPLRVIALDKSGKQPRGLWTVNVEHS